MRTLAELKTVRVGDMTREEVLLVVRDASKRLQKQLESPAVRDAIQRMSLEEGK